MNAELKTRLQEQLTEKLQRQVTVKDFIKVGGGCINHGGKLCTSAGTFFLKWNTMPLFEAEAKGLQLLKETSAVAVPAVIAYGKSAELYWLLLQWLEPSARNKNYWETAGRSLAGLHRHSSGYFGLDHDNYIGSLPQYNTPHQHWISFFMEQRIIPQLQLARQQSGVLPTWLSNGIEKLPKFLERELPQANASLLHGDLWSGNLMCGPGGNAYFIDPAVYYGHPEMELAFTKLFGGFPQAFYSAYFEVFPMFKEFEKRADFYNLYPLLVHWNLFGESYLHKIRHILNKIA